MFSCVCTSLVAARFFLLCAPLLLYLPHHQHTVEGCKGDSLAEGFVKRPTVHSLMMKFLLVFCILLVSFLAVEAFVPLHPIFRPVVAHSMTSLAAAGGKKKKRRRRKDPPTGGSSSTATTQSVANEAPVVKETPTEQVTASAPEVREEVVAANEALSMEAPSEEDIEINKSVIADVASFQFEPDDVITKGTSRTCNSCMAR